MTQSAPTPVSHAPVFYRNTRLSKTTTPFGWTRAITAESHCEKEEVVGLDKGVSLLETGVNLNSFFFVQKKRLRLLWLWRTTWNATHPKALWRHITPISYTNTPLFNANHVKPRPFFVFSGKTRHQQLWLWRTTASATHQRRRCTVSTTRFGRRKPRSSHCLGNHCY